MALKTENKASAPAHEPSAAVRFGPDGLVRCQALVVGYRAKPLLPPIDLQLQRGCFVVVVGRNGAGKSTWFKTLLGLLPPVSGRVIPARRGLRFAYVPQAADIDPLLPLRAREVVAQGRLHQWSFLRPWATAADHQACDRALEQAEVSDLANQPFRDLSRGQRQRVLFARMLATDADLALLDEPTAAMDATAEQSALELLAELTRQRNMAVVVVSHALDAAEGFADQVLLLDPDGQKVIFGPHQAVADQAAYRRQLHRVRPPAERGRAHAS